MPSRQAPPFFLFCCALSAAAHSLGWLAWNTFQPDSAAQARGAISPPAQAVLHVHLSAPQGKASPMGLDTAQPHRSGVLHGASPESGAASNALFFVPSNALDAPVVPMSAPDTSRLDGLGFSGRPIRLRLLIEANGHVLDVLTLQSAPEDARAIAHIKAMLQDTAYIPGRLQGTPVRTQLDLELQLTNGD